MRLNKHESGYYASIEKMPSRVGTASMVINQRLENGWINACERQGYRYGTLIAFVLVFDFRSF